MKKTEKTLGMGKGKCVCEGYSEHPYVIPIIYWIDQSPVLNGPKVSANRPEAHLCFQLCKGHTGTHFSQLWPPGATKYGLWMGKNNNNNNNPVPTAQRLTWEEMLLVFSSSSFLHWRLRCLLLKIPDRNFHHSRLCERALLWLFKNSSDVIGRIQKTTIPKQKWWLAAAAGLWDTGPTEKGAQAFRVLSHPHPTPRLGCLDHSQVFQSSWCTSNVSRCHYLIFRNFKTQREPER